MTQANDFAQLSLPTPILKALSEQGYEQATPIQQKCIPAMLEDNDVLGQAQTGTGKTAAFALPLLANIDFERLVCQALILTPTRELAQQVTKSIESYAKYLPQLRVASLFGGADYRHQLKVLRQGVHIVVATPGRLIDHINRGTLQLEHVKAFVLDEADEMLRMGFIEDVEWLLDTLPKQIQLAMFSATMPKQIHQIAHQYLKNPIEIKIQGCTASKSSIEQFALQCQQKQKVDLLLRLLEQEESDSAIVFVETKRKTESVAEKLKQHGIRAQALHGDIVQASRDKTVAEFKGNSIQVLVATDVAARGLDISSVSLVVNYDLPYNLESYTHRIGRTGRAGRSGRAIALFTPKEQTFRRRIEQRNKTPLKDYPLASVDKIYQQRINGLVTKCQEAKEKIDLSASNECIQMLIEKTQLDISELAAVLLQQGGLLPRKPKDIHLVQSKNKEYRDKPAKRQRQNSKKRQRVSLPMQRFRLEVGRRDGVKPRNIVGAIANEAGIEGEMIQDIQIKDNYSLVSLPKGMPKNLYQIVKNAWICGKQINLSRV